MKIMTTLMVASMLVGLVTPAHADYDYEDYLEDVRDRNKQYRKAIRRQDRAAYRAYRDGYGVRVVPRYYNSSYYSQPYPYNSDFYNGDRGGLVGGILRAIF